MRDYLKDSYYFTVYFVVILLLLLCPTGTAYTENTRETVKKTNQ